MSDGPYIHLCEKCGEWGCWGRKRPGGYVWRCTKHRWPDFLSSANAVRAPETADAVAPSPRQGRLL